VVTRSFLIDVEELVKTASGSALNTALSARSVRTARFDLSGALNLVSGFPV